MTELRCTFRLVDGAGPRKGARLLLDAEVLSGRWSELLAQGEYVGHGIRCDADPAALPDPDVAKLWGQFVTDWLVAGIGKDVLAEILERSAHDHLVRLVFRGLDPLSAQIPFETMTWPPGGNRALLNRGGKDREQERLVSIVRLAEAVSYSPPAPLGGRDPGGYRLLVVTAPGSQADATLRTIPGAQGATDWDRLSLILTTIEDGFDGSGEELTRVVAQSRPDLVILNGHGERGRGMDVASSAHAEWLSAKAIGDATQSYPSAVILAMCGSAAVGETTASSLAEEVASRAVPVVIGFQGGEPESDHVDAFVEHAVACVRQAVRDEPNHARTMTLVDWELAVIEGRRHLDGAAAITPVLYAQPGLLETRRHVLSTSRAAKTPHFEAPASIAAVPWYVPGQLLCFGYTGRVLRIPLPVDVGAVVRATVGPEPGCSVSTVGPCRPALETEHLVRLLKAWELSADIGLDVTVDSEGVDTEVAKLTHLWAARPAELAAVIRAVASIADLPVAGPVARLLDCEVACAWGAHDCAARAVEVPTGRRCGRLPAWPSLAIDPLEIAVDEKLHSDMLETLRRCPPSVEMESNLWNAIESLLTGSADADHLKNLLDVQRKEVWRAAPLLDEYRRQRLSVDRVALLPAAVRLKLGEAKTAGGLRVGPKGPARAGFAPDVL